MGVAKQLARRRGEVCAGEARRNLNRAPDNYPGYRVDVSVAGTTPGPPRTLTLFKH